MINGGFPRSALAFSSGRGIFVVDWTDLPNGDRKGMSQKALKEVLRATTCTCPLLNSLWNCFFLQLF